ncbi:putative transcriptional regulator [Pseudomonas protegens]|jgi:predicted transcriptional regulator|uniref:CopG family ribbon-helix-helix protein n=1 Tax=Pseudomonas TaxID=286 RepID=UPI000F464D48|nr:MULTISPECIES: ribbon-helix-helix domain-containing protein [Pseudomonas]MDT3418447.1 putative transcriptional regulator [Pseudomonas protegens]MDT9646544.1 ribbon-helix-helix protein, CopG family [Pseudomonas sp. JV245A]
MPATKVLTAHIPLDLADKVDQLASRLERSRAWVVKQALVAWVDQEEERCRLTLEALADVDAGRVVDHQSVLAWAQSLSGDNPLPLPK